jgi:hypothetical protein
MVIKKMNEEAPAAMPVSKLFHTPILTFLRVFGKDNLAIE